VTACVGWQRRISCLLCWDRRGGSAMQRGEPRADGHAYSESTATARMGEAGSYQNINDYYVFQAEWMARLAR